MESTFRGVTYRLRLSDVGRSCRGWCRDQCALEDACADHLMSSTASGLVRPAMSVSQTSTSIPTVARTAQTRRKSSSSDISLRSPSTASRNQPMARPWRKGSGPRSTGSGSLGCQRAACRRRFSTRTGRHGSRPGVGTEQWRHRDPRSTPVRLALTHPASANSVSRILVSGVPSRPGEFSC